MKRVLTQEALVSIANERLKLMPQYREGMQVFTATMQGEILVLRGEFFLDGSGTPTPQTVHALPVYDELAKALGSEFSVV